MIYNYFKLPAPEQGSFRQWSLKWRTKTKIRCLRFSIGGYGSIPRPIGNWCLFPRARIYGRKRFYLHWFNASVFFSPNLYAIDYN